MTNSRHPWQDWQLTAYLLGEFQPELAGQIRSAAANDPELAAELRSLQETIDSVSTVFQRESAETQYTPASTIPTVERIVAPNKSLASSQRMLMSHRIAWIGILATAASILLTMFMYSPIVYQRSLSRRADSETETARSHAASEHAEYHPTTKLSIRDKESAKEEMTKAAVAQSTTLAIAPTGGLSDEFLAQNGTTRPQLAKGLDVKSIADQSDSTALGMGGMGVDGGMGMPGGMDMNAGMGMPGMGMGMDGGMGMPGGMGMDAGKGMNSGMGIPGGMGMNAGMGMAGMGGVESAGYGENGGRITENLGKSGGSGYGGYPSTDQKLWDTRKEAERESRFWRYRAEPSADKYGQIIENRFVSVSAEPLSTFSIDVDTASYAKTRQFLKQLKRLPPVDAVRIEELVNYFEYEYSGPNGEVPFGADLAVAACPWNDGHRLVRIALQAKKMEVAERPKANIVFLLDVSGSMDQPNKLPLVKDAMQMLIAQLGENDRVAMVVYAGAAGCVLDSTTGDHQETILTALDRLSAGGSTNGGQGIQLAYNLARDHFIPGGINRVILCTDGDFNVGVTNTQELVDMVASNAKSKIFLTVLGFGMGNTNDAMMEQISNKGNGVYGFIDSRQEAKRQMIQQLAGNLITVAKDVKIQVEFNPAKVESYRLIGYENRALATEDFHNDKKDAGEIGAGHRVTALYEIVPVTAKASTPLRYQQSIEPVREKAESHSTDELLAVNLRYKQPEGDESKLLTFPLKDRHLAFSHADADFRWAASVAQFGMLLRHSQHAGNSNWQSLMESAEAAAGARPDATRSEFLEMIEIAARLSGQR